MSVAVRRDFERLLLSLVIAILVHIVIFILFPLVINLNKSELPRYSGPIYVSIEEVPKVSEISVEKVSEEKKKESTETKRVVTNSRSVSKQQEEKPLTKNNVLGKSSISTAGSMSSSKEPDKLSVPDEIETKNIVSAEEASPLYIEQREINVPLAVKKKEEEGGENVSQLPQPEKVKEPKKLALGEGTYSSLDKLLMSSGKQATGTEKSTETEESRVVSRAELSSEKGSLASNIQIQWEKPSLSREAVYTPDPVIPTWVSIQGLQLEVTVSFTLLPEGIVSTIKLLRSSGFSDVDSAVIETIRRWRFQPVASTQSVLGRITYVIKPKR